MNLRTQEELHEDTEVKSLVKIFLGHKQTHDRYTTSSSEKRKKFWADRENLIYRVIPIVTFGLSLPECLGYYSISHDGSLIQYLLILSDPMASGIYHHFLEVCMTGLLVVTVIAVFYVRKSHVALANYSNERNMCLAALICSLLPICGTLESYLGFWWFGDNSWYFFQDFVGDIAFDAFFLAAPWCWSGVDCLLRRKIIRLISKETTVTPIIQIAMTKLQRNHGNGIATIA